MKSRVEVEGVELKSRVEVEEKMDEVHSSVRLGLPTSTKQGEAHSTVGLGLQTSTETGLCLKTSTAPSFAQSLRGLCVGRDPETTSSPSQAERFMVAFTLVVG